MSPKDVMIETSDGLKLDATMTYAKTDTGRFAILCHGITDDKNESGAFISLSQELADIGINSVRFSFRGHGESEGMQSDFDVAGQVTDLCSVIDLIATLRVRTVSLVAASFGAAAVAYLPETYRARIARLAMWNPVLDFAETFVQPTLPWGIQYFGEKGQAEIDQQGFILVDGRFHLGKKLWGSFKELSPERQLVEGSTPVLIVHGTDDTYTPYSASLRLSGMRPNTTLVTIPGGDHGFPVAEEEKIARQSTVEFLSSD